MNATFAWLDKLMEFFGNLFPRLVIIETTRRGVAFRRGKHVKVMAPGLHVYWPFWTTLVLTVIVRQTVRLPVQALTTKDGRQVVACGMIRYQIHDVIKALVETWDLDGAVADESLVVMCDLVTSQIFADVQDDRETFNEKLTERVRKSLVSYGVTVLLAHLTDFSPCITLNHIGEAFRQEDK